MTNASGVLPPRTAAPLCFSQAGGALRARGALPRFSPQPRFPVPPQELLAGARGSAGSPRGRGGTNMACGGAGLGDREGNMALRGGPEGSGG